MNRRNLTLGLVAGAALLAGVGWSLRGARRDGAAETAGRSAGGASSPAAAASSADAASAVQSADLWSQRFDRPEGGELVMASLRGKPLLLNFWATWCPPCVREMPLLDQIAQRHGSKGLQVVGLAIDGPTPVRGFLEKTPVKFPIGLAGFSGTEIARTLGDSSGGLPFSVLFNAKGEVVEHKLGETNEAELQRWMQVVGV